MSQARSRPRAAPASPARPGRTRALGDNRPDARRPAARLVRRYSPDDVLIHPMGMDHLGDTLGADTPEYRNQARAGRLSSPSDLRVASARLHRARDRRPRQQPRPLTRRDDSWMSAGCPRTPWRPAVAAEAPRVRRSRRFSWRRPCSGCLSCRSPGRWRPRRWREADRRQRRTSPEGQRSLAVTLRPAPRVQAAQARAPAATSTTWPEPVPAWP
jgi:hypothetical protein